MESIRVFCDGSHLTDKAESGGCGAVGEFCTDQNITFKKINQICMEFGSENL